MYIMYIYQGPDWPAVNHVTKSNVVSNDFVSAPDEWELPFHSIITERLISEGWFGQVYCGEVRQIGNKGRTVIPYNMRKKDTIPVAIKLLKGTA